MKVIGSWCLVATEDKNDSSSGMTVIPVWKLGFVPFNKNETTFSNVNPCPIMGFPDVPVGLLKPPKTKAHGTPMEFGRTKHKRRD